MVFRKRGRLKRELRFYYNNNEVAIVSQFTYLGIIFTTGKSFKQTFDSLHVNDLKDYMVLNSCKDTGCVRLFLFLYSETEQG